MMKMKADYNERWSASSNRERLPMSISGQIRSHILDNFLFTSDGWRLENDASLLGEGIVDSTGVLELVMFVEENFGIAVEDEEISPDNFDSVNALAGYVQRKLNGKRWP
jgi:acyl carrier protein